MLKLYYALSYFSNWRNTFFIMASSQDELEKYTAVAIIVGAVRVFSLSPHTNLMRAYMLGSNILKWGNISARLRVYALLGPWSCTRIDEPLLLTTNHSFWKTVSSGGQFYDGFCETILWYTISAFIGQNWQQNVFSNQRSNAPSKPFYNNIIKIFTRNIIQYNMSLCKVIIFLSNYNNLGPRNNRCNVYFTVIRID